MSNNGRIDSLHIPDVALTPFTLAKYKKLKEDIAGIQDSILIIKNGACSEDNQKEERTKTGAGGDQEINRHPDTVPEIGAETSISTRTADADDGSPSTATQSCPAQLVTGGLPPPGFAARGVRWQASDHCDLQTKSTSKSPATARTNKAISSKRRPFNRMPTPYPVGDVTTGDYADGRPNTKIPCYNTPILRRQQAALDAKWSGFDSWTAFSTMSTTPSGQTARLYVRVPPNTNYYTYTLDEIIQTHVTRGYLTPAVPPHTITFYVDQHTAINIIITNLKNLYPAATHFCPHLEIRTVPPPATGLGEFLNTPPHAPLAGRSSHNGPVATPVAPKENPQNQVHQPDQKSLKTNNNQMADMEIPRKAPLAETEDCSSDATSEEEYSDDDGSETVSYEDADEGPRLDDFPDIFLPDVPTCIAGDSDIPWADLEPTITGLSVVSPAGDSSTPLINMGNAALPSYHTLPSCRTLVKETKKKPPPLHPYPEKSRNIPCECTLQIITRSSLHTKCAGATHMYHCGCGDRFYVMTLPNTTTRKDEVQSYDMEEVD
jgi:hypothetical protein